MNTETQSQLASFIWSICNLLRGLYKRNEHRKGILPLTVLRRFDCLLAPTKAKAILHCMHRTVSLVDDGIPLASIREVHGFEVDLSDAKQTTVGEYLGLLEGARRPLVGATFRRINVGQIKTFWACWPRTREQQTIADCLDRESAKIDKMVAKVETTIDRLQEYRNALISAAVTGKIEVRTESAQ